MANRATAESVGKIVDTDITDFAVYITLANTIVEEHLVGQNMAEDLLTLIETQLAAHFLTALMDREVSSEKVGDATVAYSQSDVGKGFMSTRYGRVAITLDSSGILSTITGVKQIVQSV